MRPPNTGSYLRSLKKRGKAERIDNGGSLRTRKAWMLSKRAWLHVGFR